jgi:hypothetical protein
MASDALKQAQAKQSRRLFIDRLINGLPGLVVQLESGVRRLADQVALPAVMLRRREALDGLRVASGLWLESMLSVAKAAYPDGLMPASTPAGLPSTGRLKFSLVDNETIEEEILSSRLSLSIKEKASWEFGDLRSRMIFLDGSEELESNEILRPELLAHLAVKSWRSAGLGHDVWRTAQSVLHEEFSLVVCEAYHEVNRQLIQQGVLPEIDLRPFIRRAHDPVSGAPQAASLSPPMGGTASISQSGFQTKPQGNAFADERPMSGAGGTFHENADHAKAVLWRLNRLMGRAPEGLLRPVRPLEASPGLGSAISVVQKDVALNLASADQAADAMNPQGLSAMLAGLRQHRQTLKAAATTSDERATIEVVALLFQSILTEDRIPSSVRVWFARLQMPVLRVAIAEPDFFATSDHPAKRLIDSMGACVMGFDAKNMQLTGAAIEREIKRVVQVVEAYPDTGSRVFQMVLSEFDRFLEHYFKSENEASQVGVSLAEQVEQRETLAIQFTIELRKMLNEVPVHEGVRDFLFRIWADVLAMTSVKSGRHGEDIKVMKRAASDLIWSASAKVSQEERAEVIRRLPPLLRLLRQGMSAAGLSAAVQDGHIQGLNQSLASAFTARTAVISKDRLDQLLSRLETLEELLPDADDLEIDESLVFDLSLHETSDFEVVTSGGLEASPEMFVWASEFQVGSWFSLDYRNRKDSVQLAWHGMRRQLILFVSPQGRCILFQQQRLAAFLQAGLLVPVEEESLTTRATRSALAQIEANPGWLIE